MKFKDRSIVFKAGNDISKNLGDIAQNEFEIRATDILVEFIKVDDVLNQLQAYKKLLIFQISLD